LLVGSVAVQC